MTGRPPKSHFLHEAIGWQHGWGLTVDGTDTWLATDAVLAGDSRSRRRGLLGSEGLPPGHALVLAPCQGIHTFGMRYSIDVVGVARDGRVVTIAQEVKPWRVALSWRAFAVVELAAGRCAETGLWVGLTVRVCPHEAGRTRLGWK